MEIFESLKSISTILFFSLTFARSFFLLQHIFSTQYLCLNSIAQYLTQKIFFFTKHTSYEFAEFTIHLQFLFLGNHEVRQSEWLQAHRMMPTAKRRGGEGGGVGEGEGGEGGEAEGEGGKEEGKGREEPEGAIKYES